MLNQILKKMTDKLQKIDCPICQHPIYFSVNQLLSGHVFKCSTCQAAISLTQESTPQVTKAMEKLEKLKINN